MIRGILDLIPMFGVYLQRHLVALEFLDRKAIRTLDIGCGDGAMSAFLSKCGKDVVAIDIAKRRRGFPYVIADATALPFKSNAFDQVVCLDVIEHIEDDGLMAKEAERVLKPKGKLVLTTPSKFWRFPYLSIAWPFVPKEKELMKFFGHVRKGYSVEQVKKLFGKMKLKEHRYFVNNISALFFDLEYSKLLIIKNILLRIFALFLYMNFKLSRKDYGEFLAVKFVKV